MSDSLTSFSYDAFKDLVQHFADTVPQLLLQRPETADLAFQIEQLQLLQALEMRFTVAIIGQMRVGKSTLLNALIGRDLAPTGVNETTATINVFRYGVGDLLDKFRVHWQDGSMEDLPLAQAAQWIGQQENSRKTRTLDFFAESEFLQIANIVDTPGTRSVLQHHEEATQGFLAEQHEAETLKYGGRADALLYVINPVAREADRVLLQLFGKRTRLPGASAYNSIAVVQKWEHLEPDPLVEAERKCERLREQLQGRVAEVIPTSGLLAQVAENVAAETWDALARLATDSTPSAVRYLLRADSYFAGEREGAALDSAARTILKDTLPLPALRFIVQIAQTRGIADGAVLRHTVLEASGLRRLKDLLQRRFFSLASLIKASTVLRKAWEPCNVARLRLRDRVEAGRQAMELGKQSEQRLQECVPTNPMLASVLDYVTHARTAVQNDSRQIETVFQQLDEIQHQAVSRFQFLDNDISCLRRLDSLSEADSLTDEERTELYRLFGGQGPDIRARLDLSAESALDTGVIDEIWDRHDYWSRRKAQATGEVHELCEHALACLSRMLEQLEEPSHA